MFKSYLAYDNAPIVKTHNLVEPNELLILDLNEDDIRLLAIATTYYIKQRYPSPHKKLPSKEEINEILELTNHLFDSACKKLNIEQNAFKPL
jgi:DNA primase large subunit